MVMAITIIIMRRRRRKRRRRRRRSRIDREVIGFKGQPTAYRSACEPAWPGGKALGWKAT